MNDSAAETLRDLLVQLQAEQAAKPSRERAILITDIEKCIAWATHYQL